MGEDGNSIFVSYPQLHVRRMSLDQGTDVGVYLVPGVGTLTHIRWY